MRYPKTVRMVEVGPRDGLQNEPEAVPTAVKRVLIEKLAACGLQTIEVGAFVSPKWVPQMADTAELLADLERREGLHTPVLVPNEKGLDRALAAGVAEIAIFGAASESFSQRNINCSIAESLARFAPVCRRALDAGLRVRGYLSCVLGCPYEGEIAPAAVVRVAEALIDLGCYEISLGDTIGIGTPERARCLVEDVAKVVSMQRVAVHFHDTYGQALGNVLACLESGVATVDSAVAGLGGCPYARGASGNLASEDLLYMLDGLGIETGVSLPGLLEAGWFISDYLGRPPASRVALAWRGRAG